MTAVIYTLCALTACLAAALLLRAYVRSGYRLLLWGGLCFASLTVNNVLLIVDRLVFPMDDLSVPRLLSALIAYLVLLYGLIWDMEQEKKQ